MNEPKRSLCKCKLCYRSNLVNTSINLMKNKFIAYMYIRFNHKLDEKSYISAKIKAVKHLHVSCSANSGTASLRPDMSISNLIVESHALFMSFKVI